MYWGYRIASQNHTMKGRTVAQTTTLLSTVGVAWVIAGSRAGGCANNDPQVANTTAALLCARICANMAVLRTTNIERTLAMAKKRELRN